MKITIKFGLAPVLIPAVVLLIFPSFFSGLLWVSDGEILGMSNMPIRFFTVSSRI